MNIIKSTFLLIIFACSISAQNYKVEKLVFSENKLSAKLSFNQINYSFENKNGINKIKFDEFSLNDQPGQPVLPYHILFVALPPNSKLDAAIKINHVNEIEKVIPQANAKIKYVNDSLLTYEEAELDINAFQSEIFPPKEIEIVGYQWMKDNYIAAVKINTHRYNWRQQKLIVIDECNIDMKIITSGNYQINTNPLNAVDELVLSSVINPEQARMWRSINPNISIKNSSENWIDYSKEYIKFGIIKDGIHRIYYDDLVNYGLNSFSLIPKNVHLYNKGKQIPIYFSGKDENKFNAGDYFEFYAEKNYTNENYREIVPYNTNYKNYITNYTDSSYYWLTIATTNGLRAKVQNSNPVSSDTIKSNLKKIHLESDVRLWYYDAPEPRTQFPQQQEHKVWTWLLIGSSGSQSVNFVANDVKANTKIKIITRLISNAANINQNAHKHGISLNSTKIQDSILYNYKQTVNLTLNSNANELKEGTNTIRIFGMKSNASFHQSLIDWIDVDYERMNKAINDSIIITINDQIINKLTNIEITNISPNQNIIIYKISPVIKKIDDFSYDQQKRKIVFSDSVSLGDKYLITKSDYILKPKFLLKKNFINLSDQKRSADNIIISHRSLINSSIQYQKFIEEKYKIKTQLVFIDDIYDEFSFGYPYPESIKEFLKTAVNNWSGIKPSYLTLIGDATYDYRQTFSPVPSIRKKNLVPSYGMPVSDSWFTMFDDSIFAIPQMFVGRIPANNDDQLLLYLNKHKKYLERKEDIWNKNYLLFSGGDPTKSSELQQIKSVNDFILNEYVSKAPIGGVGKHFYKTLEPLYNFSPYKPEEVKSSIENGGIIISYVGHSGTQTWDNGIVKVDDLMNKYGNRFSLISDFGCSTGRFAEPDVDAFGELFITQNSNGQAISYLGNSSYGYLSTSLSFPTLFYQEILKKGITNVGKAHLIAKLNLIQNYGLGDVNKVFTLCNLLFGDPLINIKIPQKPNLKIDVENIQPVQNNFNDQMEYADFSISILNYGKVSDDSCLIKIIDKWNDKNSFVLEKKIALPLFEQKLNIKIPINDKSGNHELTIIIDEKNAIDELDETDNQSTYKYVVYSNTIRTINPDNYYAVYSDELKLLNPTLKQNYSNIQLSISDNSNFQNTLEFNLQFDTLITKVNLNNLAQNKRYFWRVKNLNQNLWSQTYSFIKSTNSKYLFSTNELIKKYETNNVEYDSTKKSWQLQNKTNTLEIRSAGSNDGKFASMLYNGKEMLPNTFFWGLATAIIDSLTYEPKNIKYFVFPNPPSGDSLKSYIDKLPVGTILAMTICDDGAQSVLGYSGGTTVRKSIYTLGSNYIDSVRYRESWCIIGKKGSAKGSAFESYKKLFNGIATVKITKSVTADSGWIISPIISSSSEWKEFNSNYQMNNGKVEVYPIAYDRNGIADTLKNIKLQIDKNEIKKIDARKYSNIKIVTKLFASDKKESPIFNSLSVNYKLIPELGLNYQTVSVFKDSVELGEKTKLSFKVYNVGETTAKNFKVKVEAVSKSESIKLLEQVVDSIQSDKYKIFSTEFSTIKSSGNYNINISVDSENQIDELYEDNNFYSVPIFVKKNSKPAKLNLTIDGNDIFDGDYISSNPKIKIELRDESLVPIFDTTKVSIYLNNKRISYKGNENNVIYSFSSSNPKFVVDYSPNLVDGDYTLKVIGKNATDDLIDSTGIVKKFKVKNSLELIEFYNYPNPMKDETDFTFKLTSIPDELKINIYTIAGRKIKEIQLQPSQLKYDFNTIHWNGRDDDGNKIANGIYLCKVILKKENKTIDKILKLAKVE